MIKPGVDLRNLEPQMAVAYTIACAVYLTLAKSVCVITSAFDSVHGVNTLHQRDGKCRALDLRTNTFHPELVAMLHQSLKEALGPQFDIVLEKDHLHIEFDPK